MFIFYLLFFTVFWIITSIFLLAYLFLSLKNENKRFARNLNFSNEGCSPTFVTVQLNLVEFSFMLVTMICFSLSRVFFIISGV